jgi:hypothetical protein
MHPLLLVLVVAVLIVALRDPGGPRPRGGG